MQIYRSPASILLENAGDLIPLCQCAGCYLSDGETLHPLHMGKMMHIPLHRKDIRIFIEAGNTLYLLWVFKTREECLKTEEECEYEETASA